MTINEQQQIDLTYGDKKENALLRQLNDYFKIKLKKTKPFDRFDFIDEENKILIELKSRRVFKNNYYDTMVGFNKIQEGLIKIKQGYKIYFVFSFKDVICYHELKNDIKEKWIRNGGRKDRGKEEIKQYYYIPTHLLINIFTKNLI